ncbi:MAG: histone [archaeon]
MFSDTSIKKILKKAGAERVSKSAIKKIKEVVEEQILVIARKSVKNAEYSGRKSVRAEDVEEVLREEESLNI